MGLAVPGLPAAFHRNGNHLRDALLFGHIGIAEEFT